MIFGFVPRNPETRAVAVVAFTLFHLIYVAFLILLVGMLAFSMFRIGRFAGRNPRVVVGGKDE